jgi:hypothetical protein
MSVNAVPNSYLLFRFDADRICSDVKSTNTVIIASLLNPVACIEVAGEQGSARSWGQIPSTEFKNRERKKLCSEKLWQ